MDALATKYKIWIIGSDTVDYKNNLIDIRYKSILKYADEANEAFKKYSFTSIVPFDLSSKKGQIEPRNMLKRLLFPLSLAYQLPGNLSTPNPFYKNAETLKNIHFLFAYLKQNGWKDGLEMGYKSLDTYKETGVVGFGGSMGNNVLPYALSVFLMKSELAKHGTLKEELDTLDWISEIVGSASNHPVLWEETGYNCDAVRSMFNVRLCYILSLPNGDARREKEMLFFQKLFDKSLQISNGWADLIKSDFLGYHHKSAYLSAYAPNAFHTASLFVYLLEGTKYQVSSSSLENLSKAVLTTRVYSNKYDAPRASNGRFPTKLDGLQNNLPFFLYLANDKNPLKEELEGALMRLWNPEEIEFKESFLESVSCGIMYQGSIGSLEMLVDFTAKNIKAEKAPNGYWYFPRPLQGNKKGI